LRDTRAISIDRPIIPEQPDLSSFTKRRESQIYIAACNAHSNIEHHLKQDIGKMAYSIAHLLSAMKCRVLVSLKRFIYRTYAANLRQRRSNHRSAISNEIRTRDLTAI